MEFALAEPQHVAQQCRDVAVGESGKARFLRLVAVLRMSAERYGATASIWPKASHAQAARMRKGVT